MAAPALNTSCPVLILKAARGVLHHGALGIARSLGRLGVPVYAVVDDKFAPLTKSRYLAGYFVWGNWPSEVPEFLREISAVAEQIGQRTMLFPLDDLSAIVVSENAEALSRWFLIPAVPSGCGLSRCPR